MKRGVPARIIKKGQSLGEVGRTFPPRGRNIHGIKAVRPRGKGGENSRRSSRWKKNERKEEKDSSFFFFFRGERSCKVAILEIITVEENISV